MVHRSLLLAGFCLLVAALAIGCSATPTPAPIQVIQPTNPPPTDAPPAPTSEPPAPAAPEPPTATPNSLGVVIVAQLDPTRRVLTIYGTTPGVTVVMGGTPLPLPPTVTATATGTSTSTPPPSFTPSRVPTRGPRPPTAAPIVYTRQALRGKILFKSTRDGGSIGRPTRWLINPDGTGLQELQFEPAEALAIELENDATGVENAEPGTTRRVFGERRCYGSGQTCALYILDSQLDANLINSDLDISHGEWFTQREVSARDPAWSPTGNYIAFVSNHESRTECRKNSNIFKGTPGQNPTVRRLTNFCGGGNVGHPSFSPDGSQLTFWADDNGLRRLFVLDVGPDNNFDFRFSNPHEILQGEFQDWDPVWIK